ncbi:MAG: glycerophosphodiester phosphodiesterase [Actinomycetes bacterium]
MRARALLGSLVLALAVLVTLPEQPAHAAAAACPQVAAHRGETFERTENTVPAIRYGYGRGAETVEIDIRWTRNGKAMALHDATLDRTTNGTGLIAERTSSYVQSLRTPDGRRVPYLTSVLREARDVGRGVMLELKPELTSANADLVVSRIREYGLVGQASVASFRERSLRMIEGRAPRIRTVHFDGSGQWGEAATGGWDAYGVVTTAPEPTAEQVSWAHARGIEVVTSGNARSEWELFAGTDVDEVITDFTADYVSWRTAFCA